MNQESPKEVSECCGAKTEWRGPETGTQTLYCLGCGRPAEFEKAPEGYEPIPPEPSLDSLLEAKMKEFDELLDPCFSYVESHIGTSARIESKKWLSQAFNEVAEKKVDVEGLRELFLSILPAAKNHRIMEEAIADNNFTRAAGIMGFNAAREEMIKKIKSLPPEAFTDIINKIK